jgi:hypothetical protein
MSYVIVNGGGYYWNAGAWGGEGDWASEAVATHYESLDDLPSALDDIPRYDNRGRFDRDRADLVGYAREGGDTDIAWVEVR